MIDFKQILNKEVSEKSTTFRLSTSFNKNTYNINGCIVSDFYRIYAEFSSMLEFFSIIEELFDYLDYPMNYFDDRSFNISKASKADTNDSMEKVHLFDNCVNENYITQFIVNIKYRQNATWQGTIECTDKNKKHKFTSELELINILLDNIK